VSSSRSILIQKIRSLSSSFGSLDAASQHRDLLAKGDVQGAFAGCADEIWMACRHVTAGIDGRPGSRFESSTVSIAHRNANTEAPRFES
jgi:hypothetical protein